MLGVTGLIPVGFVQVFGRPKEISVNLQAAVTFNIAAIGVRQLGIALSSNASFLSTANSISILSINLSGHVQCLPKLNSIYCMRFNGSAGVLFDPLLQRLVESVSVSFSADSELLAAAFKPKNLTVDFASKTSVFYDIVRVLPSFKFHYLRYHEKTPQVRFSLMSPQLRRMELQPTNK